MGRQQANENLRVEMEELRNAKQQPGSKQPKNTPPPKVKAPTPSCTPKTGGKKPSPSEVARAQNQVEPQTEGARMARLRRLCEKKPSGRCWVPEEVHLRWLKGSKEEREKMCEELEDAHWSKDTTCLWKGCFVASRKHLWPLVVERGALLF